MTERYADGPRLVVHIGATSASFGLAFVPGRVDWVRTLRCAEYAQAAHAAQDYLYICQCEQVRHVVIAQEVDAAHRWDSSLQAVRQQLGSDTVLVVGASTALSMPVTSPSLASAMPPTLATAAFPVLIGAAAWLDMQLAPRAVGKRVRGCWHARRCGIQPIKQGSEHVNQ